jgi:hypothetical protein
MKGRVRMLGVVTALGLSAVGGASAASTANAAGGKPTPAPAPMASTPGGYKVVSAGPFTAAAGQQTRGTVTCPTNKKGVQTEPTGGGAYVSGSDSAININSSFPNGAAWSADVNNASGSDTQFDVYAVCSLPTKGYTVVASAVAGSAGAQSRGIATCTKGTKALGGGALSSSASTSDNINSSFPSLAPHHRAVWIVDMNNGSGASPGFTVYAVCSDYSETKTGYRVVIDSAVDNPPGSQTLASVACPSGTVPLGGGDFSNSSSTSVNLNSTYPTGAGWASYEDNTSGDDAAVTTYAVCAH